MKVKEALCAEYGDFDVTQDRDKYIGGSDIPAILGISKFVSRWQLLLEKAGLEERNFAGNRFTEYGHIIEPQIRDYINLTYNTNFVPNRVIDGDIRYHSDGFDGKRVLEVKSTSEVYSTVDGYKVYLVQLLKGMEENEVEEGILAVYHRPDDMNPVFDPSRLQVFEVKISEHKNLLNHVNKEIERFREDLKRLKENPLLSEIDFLPSGSLTVLVEKISKFESQLAQMKDIEAQLKEAKKSLYHEMLKANVKKLTLPNGSNVTRVDEVPSSTKMVREFDVDSLRLIYPTIYDSLLHEVEKKVPGKAGYVRITVK
jgi:predicted phage-related endonuclease